MNLRRASYVSDSAVLYDGQSWLLTKMIKATAGLRAPRISPVYLNVNDLAGLYALEGTSDLFQGALNYVEPQPRSVYDNDTYRERR